MFVEAKGKELWGGGGGVEEQFPPNFHNHSLR